MSMNCSFRAADDQGNKDQLKGGHVFKLIKLRTPIFNNIKLPIHDLQVWILQSHSPHQAIG